MTQDEKEKIYQRNLKLAQDHPQLVGNQTPARFAQLLTIGDTAESVEELETQLAKLEKSPIKQSWYRTMMSDGYEDISGVFDRYTKYPRFDV